MLIFHTRPKVETFESVCFRIGNGGFIRHSLFDTTLGLYMSKEKRNQVLIQAVGLPLLSNVLNEKDIYHFLLGMPTSSYMTKEMYPYELPPVFYRNKNDGLLLHKDDFLKLSKRAKKKFESVCYTDVHGGSLVTEIPQVTPCRVYYVTFQDACGSRYPIDGIYQFMVFAQDSTVAQVLIQKKFPEDISEFKVIRSIGVIPFFGSWMELAQEFNEGGHLSYPQICPAPKWVCDMDAYDNFIRY